MTALNASDHNKFLASNKDLLVVHNTSGSTPYTITISSTGDPEGRTGNVAAQTIAANEVRIFGPLPLDGWVQTDGYIYVDGNNASLYAAVIKLP